MASTKNLATSVPQGNPTLERLWFWTDLNSVFESFWTDSQFTAQASRPVERDIIEDELEERDDTAWQDFLGYHSEALR